MSRHVQWSQGDSRWTHGLENHIELGGELLQFSTVIEGSENRLESQFFKFRGLFGRTNEDSDLVVGYFGVLDEVREDCASDITYKPMRVSTKGSTKSTFRNQIVKHREERGRLHTSSTDEENARHALRCKIRSVGQEIR